MKPTVTIRQRDDSLELLRLLSDVPTCAVEIMEAMRWSPEWLDEQIHALRRRSIKVRIHDNERLSIGRTCWPRAKRRADAYSRSMGYGS